MNQAALSGRSVLIVEDEFYLADDLDRAFKTAGATVLGPVASVAAALDVIKREGVPEVALLDVNLGGEMVYAVADALAVRDIPYVFATGYDDSVIPDRYGDAPRLQKPIEPHQVVDAIASIVGAAV